MNNKDSQKPTEQIREVCCILHRRNELYQKKETLRYKYRYLKDVYRAIQVRRSFSSSEVYKKTFKMEKEQRSAYIKEYKKRNPVPNKFAETSLSDMKLILLEAEAALCQAKLRIAKHVHKYDKRLRNLAEKEVEFTSYYQNNALVNLTFYWIEWEDDDSVQAHYNMRLGKSEIKKIHDEYYANKAIDKMLST